MKVPQDCQNMEDIREAIDTLDRDIIDKFSQRFAYVKAAAKFKKDAEDVRAKERFESMLKQRRDWATAQSLDPNVIEKIYRDLVNYFIDEELQYWQQKKLLIE